MLFEVPTVGARILRTCRKGKNVFQNYLTNEQRPGILSGSSCLSPLIDSCSVVFPLQNFQAICAWAETHRDLKQTLKKNNKEEHVMYSRWGVLKGQGTVPLQQQLKSGTGPVVETSSFKLFVLFCSFYLKCFPLHLLYLGNPVSILTLSLFQSH